MKKRPPTPARTRLSLAAAALLMAAAGAAFATALWDAPPGGDPAPPTSAPSSAEQQRIAAATQAAATRRASTLTRLKESAPIFMVRTGRILPLPADTPQPRRGKPISLALDKVSTPNALRALGTASGFSIKPATSNVLTSPDLPDITLHLDNTPFLEALLELCSQAGLRLQAITPKDAVVARNEPDRGLGQWCVSGPVAVVLERITHDVSLRSMDPGERFTMELRILVEPGFNVLTYPKAITWQRFVDEKGHSLAPAEGGPPGRRTGNNSSRQEAGNLLVIQPAIVDGMGQKIANMEGTADIVVCSKSETMVVEKDDLEAGAEKSIAGMNVTIAGIQAGSPLLTTSISYERGKMEEAAWDQIKPGLAGCPAAPLDDSGTAMQPAGQPQVKGDGDSITVSQQYFATGARGAARAPRRLQAQVPVEVQLLQARVDFTNLVLP